jgi:glycosyltransferase involved in cell wall biosynthesis
MTLCAKPTVTVILPVYNGENYVRFAIESVLNQTVKDLELVVVDDGSTDATPEIIASYDGPIRYVRQENTGVAGAFNHGLRLAQGKYISWLSHDDIFHQRKLEKQLEALGKLDSPGICYTDIESIDSKGKVVTEYKLPEYERGETLRRVLTGGPICSACYSLMYDRRCVEEVGGYAVELKYTQDVDMLSRLVRRFPLLHIAEHGSVKCRRSFIAGWRQLHSKSCFPSMAPNQPSRRGHSGFAGWEIYYPRNLNRFVESRSRSIVERGSPIRCLPRCWLAELHGSGGYVFASGN